VSVAVGDFNGDGKPDLAVADQAADTISVLVNTTAPNATTPTFAAKVDFAAGFEPASIVVGDLNGDGRPDLAVVHPSSKTVSVFLNTAAPGATTPTFAAEVDFATGSTPSSIAVSDLNGDGKPDLAVANGGSNTVSVLLNTTAPGATQSFAAKVDFATGSGPRSIAVGDLNGDGKPDLAVANEGTSTVSVLLNTTAPGATTPSFAAKVDLGTSSEPVSIAVGDLNGDGKPDLAVANFSSDTVSVLLNTTVPGATTPSFAAKVDFATGPLPESVAVGDLNGDGKPDLAVVDANANTVSIVLNTTTAGATTPSFAAKVDFATGTNPRSIAVGDFNGEGKRDLAVANQNANTVSVLLNATAAGATTPSFAAKVDFATGTAPFSLAVGDLNGDGKPDLAVANDSSNTVSVLLNTTAPGSTPPSFAAKVDFATGVAPVSVAAGDLDGDGKPDLAIANAGPNTVSVLLAQ